MQKQYSISEAKNRLPSIIHDVEDGDIAHLTRRGRSVAILMSTENYQSLSMPKEGFWRAFQGFKSKIADKNVCTIEDEDFDGLRDKSPGREIHL